MKTFREYLIECEIDDFYIDIKSTQDFYNKYNCNIHNKFPLLFQIHEAVILPENLKINSDLTDVESLNKEFKKMNIIFEINDRDNPKKLDAYYNQEKDEIHIFFSTKNTKLEIEAMIGHEMIHKVQNKLNVKYIEQATNLVNRINVRQEKMQDLMIINTVESMKEWQKLLKLNEKERLEFLQNSVFEKMAYAYSEVKMNKDMKLSDLLTKFKKSNFIIDNKLKKYIGMYWLIKDKI